MLNSLPKTDKTSLHTDSQHGERNLGDQKISLMEITARCLSDDRNDQRKLMRLNELHKYSEGDVGTREHPSETIVFHNEDGNPARANIKQALGYLKDGDGVLRCQVNNRMPRHDLHLL
ncbi:hypothetical protein Tco_1003066 [Tanacetum coccineum]|uniref:LAGLIDADG homing endonuclease n=1 Tax=Tanacetum coccineum TaxID=301880 RepID=A0ABQ5F814_9ASTR